MQCASSTQRIPLLSSKSGEIICMINDHHICNEVIVLSELQLFMARVFRNDPFVTQEKSSDEIVKRLTSIGPCAGGVAKRWLTYIAQKK